MKKVLSIIISVCVLVSALTISIYAINLSLTTTRITVNGNSILVSDDAFEEAVRVTSEEAGYIAELFVEDMIASGTCGWDENTAVVDIVTLYDETGTAATAHSVELTEGYVLVSAFTDTESLIPEWSDTAEPAYENIETVGNNSLIYLGGYEYFVDSSTTTVTDINGNEVNKSELINYIEGSRDISNMPEALLESCTINTVAETYGNNITNPIDHANDIYGEGFSCVDYCNNWDGYMEYYTTGEGVALGYGGCCVPVAVTNIALAHMNKYNLDYSYYENNCESSNDLFEEIATFGLDNNYYNFQNGVSVVKIDNYTLAALRDISIGTNVVGLYWATTENIKADLNDNYMLILRLYAHENYGGSGGHAVLCFAYTTLRNENTGFYKNYIKVADGWASSARYLDMATVIPDSNVIGDVEPAVLGDSYITQGNDNFDQNLYNAVCGQSTYVKVGIWR